MAEKIFLKFCKRSLGQSTRLFSPKRLPYTCKRRGTSLTVSSSRFGSSELQLTIRLVFGTARKAGEEWLVTLENAEAYIPDVYEHVVGTVDITTLSNRQYCVIIDPYDETAGRNRFGVRVLRKGETTFFLRPGERLENGIQEIYVLASDEALLLAAREEFSDDDGDHKPGDRWMVRGPKEYIPSVEMEVLELRRAIPLDENEGIYIRDIQSGKVNF